MFNRKKIKKLESDIDELKKEIEKTDKMINFNVCVITSWSVKVERKLKQLEKKFPKYL